MADLTFYILATLIGAGYYLNKDKTLTRKTVEERKKMPENEQPSGDNIYHSTHYKKTRGQELALAEKRYRNAHVDPHNTNIISQYHNTLIDGVRTGAVEDLDKAKYIEHRKKFINETSDPSGEIHIEDSPMFNPLVYTSASKPTDATDPAKPGFSAVESDERFKENFNGNDIAGFERGQREGIATGALIRKEDSRYLQEADRHGLSGGWGKISENFEVKNNASIRGMEHFNSYTVHGPRNSNNPLLHNNMVPFISTKTAQYTDPYTHQGLLERFTGQTNDETELRARPKREIDNLYDGTPHQTFIHGAPSDLSYQLDRHHTSNLKQNVLPAEQVRVGPGLNYGYEARPSDGFHSLYRPQFRNIDELRVNKKNVYAGRIVHGKEFVDKPEQIGNVYKRRPDRFGLLGPKRWNRTTGGHIAPQVRENFVAYRQHRQDTHVPYSGIAGNSENTRPRPTFVLENECGGTEDCNSVQVVTQFPRVNQFPQAEPRNTYAPGHNLPYFDYAKEGYVAYEEERQSTEAAHGAHRLNVHAPDLKRSQQQPYDNARPTTRQTLNVKDYFGVVGSRDLERSQQQPYDTAKPTTRQTLNVKDYFGAAGSKDLERSQQQPYDTAKPTTRQTLNVKDYMGIAGSRDLERSQQQPYDTAKPTTRQTLNVKDYVGIAGNKEYHRNQQQPYDTAKPTTRQTLNVKDYFGASSAKPDNVRPQDYQSMYNATGKNRQESILASRAYGANRETGVWNGVCSVNMKIKDRAGYDITKYGPNLDRLYTNAPTVGIQFENSTSKNQRDRHGIRQPEEYLVEQFKRNPYTLPLNSAPQINCNMPPDGICSEDQLRRLMLVDAAGSESEAVCA